jgi:hypothetical protein
VNLDHPIRTRPITPEEALDGLRDLLARAHGIPWEKAAAEVKFATPLDELAAVDGIDPVGVELYFGTGSLSHEFWERVVEFGTVGGLCHALARFVEVPAIEPVTVLGRPCRVAGAYAVIRSLLVGAGADVSELQPSSPLLPYVWLWPDVFRWEIPRLAPGRVPPVLFLNRRLTRRILGILFGLGGALFGMWMARGFPVLGGFLAAICAKVLIFDLLLVPWAARRRNWSVRFGDLYDFRDLATVLANHPGPTATAAA